MTEMSEARKVIAAALDRGIVAAMEDSGWVSNIEDEEGAVIPTTIRVDGVIDLIALAVVIDQALGGLTPEWGVAFDGYSSPEESFDNKREAHAEANTHCLSCDSCRDACPKHVESHWVSAWTPEVTE
jgi:hypothetical protein